MGKEKAMRGEINSEFDEVFDYYENVLASEEFQCLDARSKSIVVEMIKGSLDVFESMENLKRSFENLIATYRECGE